MALTPSDSNRAAGKAVAEAKADTAKRPMQSTPTSPLPNSDDTVTNEDVGDKAIAYSIQY